MTVLVGYLPTDLGRAALRAGVTEAARREEPLHVLNCATGAAYADAALATAEDLADAVATARAAGVEAEAVQQTQALDPAASLVEAAADLRASVVVIGMRHRSRTGKFLLGSTAQTVLLRAHCDVLAVKHDADRPHP